MKSTTAPIKAMPKPMKVYKSVSPSAMKGPEAVEKTISPEVYMKKHHQAEAVASPLNNMHKVMKAYSSPAALTKSASSGPDPVATAPTATLTKRTLPTPVAMPMAHTPKEMKTEVMERTTHKMGGSASKMGGGTEKVWGLLGNDPTTLHNDIRNQARKLEMEGPNTEDIKKGTHVPAVEDVAAESDKAVGTLMKEVNTIGGNSGKKNVAAEMTDADQACYASKYTDLGKTNAKEHFRTVGDA